MNALQKFLAFCLLVVSTLLAPVSMQTAEASSTCSSSLSSLDTALRSTSGTKGTLVAAAWTNYSNCLQTSGISYSKITVGDCGYLKNLVTNHYKLEVSSGTVSYSRSEKALYEFELCATGKKSSVLSSTYLGNCNQFQPLVASWSNSGDLSMSMAASHASEGCYARYQIPIFRKPTISASGTIQLGVMLTAVPGNWSENVEFTYKWLRNGTVISGAQNSRYVITAEDQGQRISVQVVGAKWGYSGTAVTMSSLETSIPAALPSQIRVPVPSIAGALKVGSVLTVKPGVWDAGVKLTYQWNRNQTPISGATGLKYKVTFEDLDTTISLVITGSKSGYQSRTASTQASSTISQGLQTLTPTPKLTAVTKVGQVIKVSLGKWDAGVSLEVKWYRDGEEIPELQGVLAYKLVSNDKQHRFSVSVTSSKDGYGTISKTSALSAVIK